MKRPFAEESIIDDSMTCMLGMYAILMALICVATFVGLLIRAISYSFTVLSIQTVLDVLTALAFW